MSHLMLISIVFAANISMMINYIMEIATFDLIDTDDVYEEVFNMSIDEEPYTESFSDMGYETNNIILNMGTVFLVIFSNILAFAVILIFRIMQRCCCKARLKKYADKLYNTLVWNGVIRLVLEGYLEFTVICFLSYLYVHTETAGDIFSIILSVFCTFMLVVCTFMLVVFPGIMIVMIIKNRKNMTEEAF